MKRYTIPAGTGVNVGADFWRAPADTELRVADEHGTIVYGYVDSIAGSPLGFMRPEQTGPKGARVHVPRRLLREVE